MDVQTSGGETCLRAMTIRRDEVIAANPAGTTR
jgi:hypothetical protein